ncbi:methylated-DNA--[protein]-cysteine S-methyltransferase [Hymenobacter sp. BT523]|uniref:methylated-DNA--[protein]-cysteine S-methyltransferase n=1 Tax=Hymenobacter sp. BT523 TaxID=2795725 RepID=UPI0018EBE0F8|nr:methylated-DNA--[protein]-cysteine S-methyltransferase [Hymenobacter sp. BT523]MBJ6108480.1 methylated-DNA--[protein]-cysteine S-methyltransferase [Hymenobacter sp. BT523]
MNVATATLLTPLGPLALTGSDAGLSAVTFLNEAAELTAPAAVASCLRAAHEQLRAYFGRELRDFSLTYAPAYGTDFQRQVWQALAGIGYGRTASYLEVARRLNNPKSVRAVGAANGQNPLAIVWPCHRIIGADGSLTGYAGGMHRKQWLLEFEQPVRQGGLFG